MLRSIAVKAGMPFTLAEAEIWAVVTTFVRNRIALVPHPAMIIGATLYA